MIGLNPFISQDSSKHSQRQNQAMMNDDDGSGVVIDTLVDGI